MRQLPASVGTALVRDLDATPSRFHEPTPPAAIPLVLRPVAAAPASAFFVASDTSDGNATLSFGDTNVRITAGPPDRRALFVTAIAGLAIGGALVYLLQRYRKTKGKRRGKSRHRSRR